MSEGLKLRRSPSFSQIAKDELETPKTLRISYYDLFIERMHCKVVDDMKPISSLDELDRNETLKILFNDLTCNLDQSVDDLITKNREPTEIPRRYYLLLARYYVEHPERANELLQTCLPLWNNAYFQIIFPLLFHEWLFYHCNNDQEFSIKRFSIFIKGSNKLFWLDLENGSIRFYHIWKFLKDHVLLDESMWEGLLVRKYMEVINLVVKFFFYYEETRGLHTFVLKMKDITAVHKHDVDLPRNHKKINFVNLFSNEVVRTMRLIKNEKVLILYLSCCTFFQGEMAITGRKTRLRLYDLLSDLATSGYPSYPTSHVKSAARKTIDTLWPYGSFWRSMIRFSFRIFRPLSWVVWFENQTKQILLYIVLVYHFIIQSYKGILEHMDKKKKKKEQDKLKLLESKMDSKREQDNTVEEDKGPIVEDKEPIVEIEETPPSFLNRWYHTLFRREEPQVT